MKNAILILCLMMAVGCMSDEPADEIGATEQHERIPPGPGGVCPWYSDPVIINFCVPNRWPCQKILMCEVWFGGDSVVGPEDTAQEDVERQRADDPVDLKAAATIAKFDGVSVARQVPIGPDGRCHWPALKLCQAWCPWDGIPCFEWCWCELLEMDPTLTDEGSSVERDAVTDSTRPGSVPAPAPTVGVSYTHTQTPPKGPVYATWTGSGWSCPAGLTLVYSTNVSPSAYICRL